MSLMRLTLNTAIRGSQNVLFPSLGTRFPLPGRFPSHRFYSTPRLLIKLFVHAEQNCHRQKELLNYIKQEILEPLLSLSTVNNLPHMTLLKEKVVSFLKNSIEFLL